jgi:hypothetical protein
MTVGRLRAVMGIASIDPAPWPRMRSLPDHHAVADVFFCDLHACGHLASLTM